jgi:hypothetical protein
MQMNPMVFERARAARILVAITFHFDAARLGFLAEVLRSLAEFPVAAMHVAILTNTAQEEELTLLCRLCAESLLGKTFSVRPHGDLAHPFDLTWCHKTIIAEEFIAGSAACYTHFIYIEDDIRLSFANFCYFVDFRERLRAFGLLPAFVRMEYGASLGGFVASDAFWPVYVPVQTHVRLGDITMVNMPNPYNPGFILDVELATEYAGSRSFDWATSAEVCAWGVRERAAMGLCLENVPPPFHTRYVVPVSAQTDMVPPAARISHLPNNYADNPHMPLGKVRMDELFQGARALSNGDWWPSSPAVAASTLPQSGATTSSERYFLVSYHDTILFGEVAAQQFRHGPFGIAPLNLALELEGSRGRLVLLADVPSNDRNLSFATPAGETRVLSDTCDPDLQIEWFADGSIGLRIDELYVAADLDGSVRNDRSWCRAFEQFRLIRTDTIDGLAVVQRHSWTSHGDGQTVTLAPQPIDFGRELPHESSALAATRAPGAIESRRDIVVGPARLRLIGRTPQIVFNRAGDADPNAPLDMFINDITGTRYGFSRLAPPEGEAGRPGGGSPGGRTS